MPARRLKAFGLQSPSGNVRGLQSPLTLTCPRGYNPLGQSLEFA